MKTLVIGNDPPYGTERSCNGLRLAGALSRRDGVEVLVFLMGDAVGCAHDEPPADVVAEEVLHVTGPRRPAAH